MDHLYEGVRHILLTRTRISLQLCTHMEHTRISPTRALIASSIRCWHGILIHADLSRLKLICLIQAFRICLRHLLVCKQQLTGRLHGLCSTPPNRSQHGAWRWRSLSHIDVWQLGLSVEDNNGNIINDSRSTVLRMDSIAGDCK